MPGLRMQIVYTYRCNLSCQWCDRYMDLLSWEDSDILLRDLVFAEKLLRWAGVEIEQLRIAGGEPLVHPRFVELTETVVRLWGGIEVKVFTNGTMPMPEVPGVKYWPSPVDTKRHRPCMVSPHDLGVEPRGGFEDNCRVTRRCGRVFDTFGFACCQYAGPIGRVLGIDPYEVNPVLKGDPRICRHCHHSLGWEDRERLWEMAEQGEIEVPTTSFQQGMDRGVMNHRRFQERL